MIWLKISLFVSSLIVLTYCNVTYDQKLILHKCAENKAVDSDYVPRGHVINIGDLPVYEAPDHVDSRRMLIAIYDIFGFSHPNMKQITDHMGLQAWLQHVGDWDTIIRPDLINIINHYRSQGVEEFAIYGMCWGGAIAAFSAIELYNDFKASALVHPSLVTNDQAYYVRTPMYLMPSRDEPDMLPFYQVLRANFGDDSGHLRFDDFHGFAGARGNFSDPVNQSHVNEVIRTLGVFFGRLLDGY